MAAGMSPMWQPRNPANLHDSDSDCRPSIPAGWGKLLYTQEKGHQMNRQIMVELQAIQRDLVAMADRIEQGQDCLAAVRLGLAVRRALSRISLTLLAGHLRAQVTAALTCPDPDCRARQVGQLAETYQTLLRLLCPACHSEWPVLAKCEVDDDSSSSCHHQ